MIFLKNKGRHDWDDMLTQINFIMAFYIHLLHISKFYLSVYTHVINHGFDKTVYKFYTN